MELHLSSDMKFIDILETYLVTKPILEGEYIAQVQENKQRNFPKRYYQFPQKAPDPDGFMEIVYCIFEELETPMLFKLIGNKKKSPHLFYDVKSFSIKIKVKIIDRSLF